MALGRPEQPANSNCYKAVVHLMSFAQITCFICPFVRPFVSVYLCSSVHPFVFLYHQNASKDEPVSLLVAQTAAVPQFEDSTERQTKPGVVSWSPPLPNWNPWTSCNIDEGPLAMVSWSCSALLYVNWMQGNDRIVVLIYPSYLSLIHIWRCRRIERCRSRWSPYH